MRRSLSLVPPQIRIARWDLRVRTRGTSRTRDRTCTRLWLGRSPGRAQERTTRFDAAARGTVEPVGAWLSEEEQPGPFVTRSPLLRRADVTGMPLSVAELKKALDRPGLTRTHHRGSWAVLVGPDHRSLTRARDLCPPGSQSSPARRTRLSEFCAARARLIARSSWP